MIQIILVNEESRASQYGIGTYIKQLCLILSQKQGIHLSVICCRSTKNDFYIERKGDIDYYHIPDTIQNNDPEIRIKTYYKNIWYLIFPYFSSHSKENIILHINYYQHIHLLNTFRAFFSKGRCCFTIHYMDWCFKIKGNYSYLKSILYKELDSIKNPLEKNIKEICEKEKNVFEQVDKIICLSNSTQNLLSKIYDLPINKFCILFKDESILLKAFMTGTSINTLFSFVNFIVFGFVLAYYDWTILGLFLAGNGLYVAWVLAFMRWRRELDVKRFSQAAGEQSNLFQLITGMQEIKLNNCETKMRWKWERIQVKLFKIGIKGLALQQYQQLGAVFFNQTTNILISFIAARAVVQGDMTLGMMMSVTYIVGQLSSPIEQLIDFSRSLQDAKISLERLGEIHGKEDEEQAGGIRLNVLPDDRTLRLENLSFSYDGADRDYVLEDINLTIPHNRVTAIVGASGSGKTTIVKLLLGFYNPNKGDVRIGDTSLKNLNPHVWRSKTGSVMQDGFIFSDTIANNIAPGEEVVDKERLLHAVTVANIRDFIDSLPLGYNTKIGMEGNGVSQGQRQRILIARAVYKNPDFIFLDEATNALDANNEREIMEQLHAFYKGRTVVVVAHRLSTVRDADKNIHVVWFGGEPLLGIKQIESLYRKMILIPDKNYSFSIISNGFLISPDIIKLFKEMKLQHIQITLDGLKRDSQQDKIHKNENDTFSRTIKRI